MIEFQPNYKQQVLTLAKQKGILKAKELQANNIPYVYLGRLVKEGLLQKVGRGLYKLSGKEITEHHSLVEAASRVSHGVIALLSALNFHHLTTQLPFEVWIAIENNARAPKTDTLSIRYLRFSGQAFTEGVETHILEGVPVQIYSPAKTIADCFKYRNKIGLDVALEALRDGLKEDQVTVDQIWHYAKICRVQNVMRPYLEAIA